MLRVHEEDVLMCGRYQLTLPLEALTGLFELDDFGEPFPPRYNIAPTQPIHVVRVAAAGRRRLDLMRWGLQPSWVKDPAAFPLLINARAETAAEKPAFRNALRRRRSVMPATAFYEWRTEAGAKQPYAFTQDGPFGLAGIYETWTGPNGEELDTAAILTAEAEGEPAQFHSRMPLTVPLDRLRDWLDPANDDARAALALTERAPYRATPVSKLLSNARNEGVALMTPDPPGTGADTAADGDLASAQPRLL